eukprot:3254222-Pleurochrysis_carterae.AAC.1
MQWIRGECTPVPASGWECARPSASPRPLGPGAQCSRRSAWTWGMKKGADGAYAHKRACTGRVFGRALSLCMHRLHTWVSHSCEPECSSQNLNWGVHASIYSRTFLRQVSWTQCNFSPFRVTTNYNCTFSSCHARCTGQLLRQFSPLRMHTRCHRGRGQASAMPSESVRHGGHDRHDRNCEVIRRDDAKQARRERVECCTDTVREADRRSGARGQQDETARTAWLSPTLFCVTYLRQRQPSRSPGGAGRTRLLVGTCCLADVGARASRPALIFCTAHVHDLVR